MDSTDVKPTRSLPLAAGLLFTALPASAHLVSTGFGPVYDGIAHFALTPEQFLPMVALALLAGLRGPVHARRLLFLLPPAWLVAFLAAIAPPALAPLVAALALLLAGVLLASDAKFPPAVVVGLALVFGLALGAVYGTPADSPGLLGAVGACAGVFVVLALPASVSLPLRAPAARIAVRVGGSWTAALGLLLVGWWVHGHWS